MYREVLEIQDKFQHVCRIVSIRNLYQRNMIRQSDMYDESHQFVSEFLETQDKFQHVCRNFINLYRRFENSIEVLRGL